MDERVKHASEYQAAGFNCAQAVAAAFSEQYGMSAEDALRLHSGFGGGFCMGELCGAAAGAASIIGLKYGRSKQEDTHAKLESKERTQAYMQRFLERYPSLQCRELRGAHAAGCRKIVEDAATLLVEMGL